MLTSRLYWLQKGAGLVLVFWVLGSFWGVCVADAMRAGVINAPVQASLGGVFTDNPDNPSIRISIPPGALSDDARLQVRPVRDGAGFRSNQTPASPVYRVALHTSGARDVLGRTLRLQLPMTIEITAEQAPVHPQLGEIARREKNGWSRMQANFYKASSNSVMTRSRNIRGRYRVVHRTLQARSGPAVERGRDLYFNETWTNEYYWTQTFGLHEVMNEVTPAAAVSAGAQVDISKVPQWIVELMLGDDYAAKQAALQDAATTRALIRAGAVLGVRGFYDDAQNPDHMTGVGLTCALCHVKVTKNAFQIAAPPAEASFLPIGTPLLGGPNETFDAGALLALTPLVQSDPEGQNIDAYLSWGPGNFDTRFLPNNPVEDNVVNPTQIIQNWNYVDLAEQGYATNWIGIMQLRPDNNSLASGPERGIDVALGINGAWGTPNAVIKNFELGNPLPQWVFDALAIAEQNEPGNAIPESEYRAKLLDLKAFMESIVSPPPGDFDEAMAQAGWALFYGKANCVACHSTAEGTGRTGEYFTHIVENPPQGLLGLGIRVPGLRGLAYTAPYFHDGSAATLYDVVARYVSPDIPEVPSILTTQEQAQIVEYLKSR